MSSSMMMVNNGGGGESDANIKPFGVGRDSSISNNLCGGINGGVAGSGGSKKRKKSKKGKK